MSFNLDDFRDKVARLNAILQDRDAWYGPGGRMKL